MKHGAGKYFGPYTSAAAVKDTIELLCKLYKVRTCNRNLPKDEGKDRPCLNYHIGQCDAPCQGYVSGEEYRRSIDEVVAFLNGDYKKIMDRLTTQMQEASEKMEYEEAARYRDLLMSVSRLHRSRRLQQMMLMTEMSLRVQVTVRTQLCRCSLSGRASFLKRSFSYEGCRR